eukprot:COSAG05_NODE_364_length_10775_cov_3.222836_7_plen_94_part_00
MSSLDLQPVHYTAHANARVHGHAIEISNANANADVKTGADDVGHYLHHTKFECNYGFSFPNYLDRAFCTYDDGKKYAAKRQQRMASPASNKAE